VAWLKLRPRLIKTLLIKPASPPGIGMAAQDLI